jgi:hypothetical protein
MVVILTLSAADGEGSLYFVVAFVFVFCFAFVFTSHTQSRSLSPEKWLPHLWCNYDVTSSRHFFLRRNNKTRVSPARAPRHCGANSPRITTGKPWCHHEFTTSCIAWRISHDQSPHIRLGHA